MWGRALQEGGTAYAKAQRLGNIQPVQGGACGQKVWRMGYGLKRGDTVTVGNQGPLSLCSMNDAHRTEITTENGAPPLKSSPSSALDLFWMQGQQHCFSGPQVLL
jgi:hypothetical protein